MISHTLPFAAALTAGVWLTRHGPQNELWLPWPRVSHPPAHTLCHIVSHLRHPHFVTAQLTRASAGVWIFVPSGGECIALQLANAAADARVRVRMRACGSIMCIHIAFMRMIYWHAALQVWAVPEWAGGGSSQTGA